MTNKPATPLPWIAVADKAAPYSGIYVDKPGRQKQVVHENGATKDADAAYIVTASNAYPRLLAERQQLVEALRKTIACAREWHEPESAGDKKAYHFDLSDHPRMKNAIALLRSLGEKV